MMESSLTCAGKNPTMVIVEILWQLIFHHLPPFNVLILLFTLL